MIDTYFTNSWYEKGGERDISEIGSRDEGDTLHVPRGSLLPWVSCLAVARSESVCFPFKEGSQCLHLEQ